MPLFYLPWEKHRIRAIRSTRVMARSIGSASLPLVFFAPWVQAAKPIGVLLVTPTNGLVSSGTIGGPFSPSSQLYALSNSGTASLGWSAIKSQSWVSLSVSSGTLAVGASANVTVSVNPNANSLSVGNYADTVTFTNLTDGNGTTNRLVTLTVNPIPAPSGPTATAISTNQITLSWTDKI